MTTTARKSKRTWLLALIGVVLSQHCCEAGHSAVALDYDEPVYMRAGFDYARALRAGDWNGVIDYAGNQEHPALVKLLYGLVLLVLGRIPPGRLAVRDSRPLCRTGHPGGPGVSPAQPTGRGSAGRTYHGRQVYRPDLPGGAAPSGLAGRRAGSCPLRPAGVERSRRLPDAWFWLSALALGVTAAGKFTYLPVVLVILYLAVLEKRHRWYHLLLYLAVSVPPLAAQPTLWHEPVTRLYNALFFHVGYSRAPTWSWPGCRGTNRSSGSPARRPRPGILKFSFTLASMG